MGQANMFSVLIVIIYIIFKHIYANNNECIKIWFHFGWSPSFGNSLNESSNYKMHDSNQIGIKMEAL